MARKLPEAFKKTLRGLIAQGWKPKDAMKEAWRVYKGEAPGMTRKPLKRNPRRHPGYKGKVGELPSQWVYKGYVIKFNALQSRYYIEHALGGYIGSALTRKEAEQIIDSLTRHNPVEMRPRVKVSKKYRMGTLGRKSPLKGFKFNRKKSVKRCPSCGQIVRGSVCVRCQVPPVGTRKNPYDAIGAASLIFREMSFKHSVTQNVWTNFRNKAIAWLELTKERKNPIAVYNPARGGKILPMHNVEIRYQRTAGDYKTEWFRHPFKSSVSIIGLPDGSIQIKSKSGKKLWGTA